jgi:hypothetical protein
VVIRDGATKRFSGISVDTKMMRSKAAKKLLKPDTENPEIVTIAIIDIARLSHPSLRLRKKRYDARSALNNIKP